jgi:hypothetical protein
MPTPPPKKEKVQEIIRRYLAAGGPERSWSVAAKACGFVNGKEVKPYIEYWANVYQIHVPARTYETMGHRERQMAEIRYGQGIDVKVSEEMVEPERKLSMPMPIAFTQGDLPTYVSRPDNTFVFGLTSDNHLGSKYERLDVLNDIYDKFERWQVDRVFNCGNWIDGYKVGLNEHDVHIHHMEGQLRYLVREYPQRAGIKTYAVTGEDHEGWWARGHGIDIGKRAEQDMRDAGRDDWVNLGFMEAHVRFVNYNTGKEAIGAFVHPGGGTAYALSYSVQKIIEALEGGEKPAFAAYGHYHKMWVGNIRNVWVCQVPCTQDQTVFTRNKIKQEVHVGALGIQLEQDPETGALLGCLPRMQRYFVRSWNNNRWNKSGDVSLAERRVA